MSNRSTHGTGVVSTDRHTARAIRILHVEPALRELLTAWLEPRGYQVLAEIDDAAADRPRARPDEALLAIVGVPYARFDGALELLRGVARRYPHEPILALSASFLPSVRCQGDCARALGIAGVLPAPLTREVLLQAVEQVLHSRGS